MDNQPISSSSVLYISIDNITTAFEILFKITGDQFFKKASEYDFGSKCFCLPLLFHHDPDPTHRGIIMHEGVFTHSNFFGTKDHPNTDIEIRETPNSSILDAMDGINSLLEFGVELIPSSNYVITDNLDDYVTTRFRNFMIETTFDEYKYEVDRVKNINSVIKSDNHNRKVFVLQSNANISAITTILQNTVGGTDYILFIVPTEFEGRYKEEDISVLRSQFKDINWKIMFSDDIVYSIMNQ